LDRHVRETDWDAQCKAFAWQLAQAAERNLPVSIHCLKATDPLLHQLREKRLPSRGVHLHAYSGSAEEADQFVEIGAYFSFHASQLNAPARKAQEALRGIPLDRLLIESDAPDTLANSMTQRDYLETAYQRAAAVRRISLASLSEQVMNNFQRYFLDD
jgi:TatD DNase family protein